MIAISMETTLEVFKDTLVVVGPRAIKKIKQYCSKDHGSKVKRGAFQECPIEEFGDKACIVVDDEKGRVLMLTADTIQSCQLVKKKVRQVGLERHTFYYYDIVFKNGYESYVRMRTKYRKAMEKYL